MLMRLRRALEEYVIGGIETTIRCISASPPPAPSSTATTTCTGWKFVGDRA